MKLKTEIETSAYDPNLGNKVAVEAEGLWLAITMPPSESAESAGPVKVLRVRADQLREFLIRSKPNPEMFKP